MTNKTPNISSSLDIELLLRYMPDLYLILDSKLIIVAVSDAYAKATHMNKELLIGQYIFDAFPDNPQDEKATGVNNLRTSLARVLKDKVPDAMAIQKYHIPSSAQRLNEFEEHYWSPVNTPILNDQNEVEYIIHRAEDVTDFLKFKKISMSNQTNIDKMDIEVFSRAQQIQETNNRLHESEERLKLFLDSCKDYALLMLDPEGYITTWNVGAGRIKGYRPSEIIGKHFSIFYTDEAKESNHPQKELEYAKKNGRYEEEGLRVRKDGSTFWANVIITPIYNDQNTLIGFGKVTRDLTETKKMEDLKTEFISLVSHELRTPLTSILGSMTLLESFTSSKFNTKEKGLLTIAKRNCERLIRLINNLLDIQKIESGTVEFQFNIYDLNVLIKEAIEENLDFAAKFNVTIKAVPLPLDVKIYVDKDKFIQVVTNLISNAVKFSPPGDTVEISATFPNEIDVRIQVKDNGSGIPDEFLPKIFQKFAQAKQMTSEVKGTGLGLSISKAIIEKFKGKINFDTEKGKGTIFYFDLPIWRQSNEVVEHFKSNIMPTLLIYENEQTTIELIDNIIKEEFNYVAAPTLEEMKSTLNKKKFDALILDINTTEQQNVFTFINDIRNEISSMPIIIFSLQDSSSGFSEVSGGAFNIIDWIQKPIREERLRKTIATLKERIKTTHLQIIHIEDDVDLANIVALTLENEAQITHVGTIKAAREELLEHRYDLAILDINLPDGKGLELLPDLSRQHIPILIYSAYNEVPAEFKNEIIDILVKTKTTNEQLIDTVKAALKKP